jgi:hypothetical protein
LRHDKELVLFPLMSGAACLLVMASFAVPLWGMPWFRQAIEHKEVQQNPVMWALMFAFYVINYFVVVFLQCRAGELCSQAARRRKPNRRLRAERGHEPAAPDCRLGAGERHDRLCAQDH